MQAIDILIAKEVDSSPQKTLTEVLDAIAESGIASHMAAVAPFGVVAPLSKNIAESDAKGAVMGAKGRLFEPQVFHDRVKTAMEARQGTPNSRSETLRGCPIANKGVLINAEGKPELTEVAPLTELTREYVRLLKAVLEHREARSPTTP